jgi:hypothetical protein
LAAFFLAAFFLAAFFLAAFFLAAFFLAAFFLAAFLGYLFHAIPDPDGLYRICAVIQRTYQVSSAV